MWKFFERRSEKRPRSEQEREQREFEQRLALLPDAEREIYKKSMEARTFLEEYEHVTGRKRGLFKSIRERVRALEAYDKRWSRFALSMLEGVHTKLIEYAGNPETFKKISARFALVPLISDYHAAHVKDQPYNKRSSFKT